MDRRRFARQLRTTMTDAEARLWSHLRNRQFKGVKFRRQMPIDRFVADFAAVELKLVIELDGSQHVERESYDAERTVVIESAGYMVLRFWNYDVLDNIEGVLDEIASVIDRQRELLG